MSEQRYLVTEEDLDSIANAPYIPELAMAKANAMTCPVPPDAVPLTRVQVRTLYDDFGLPLMQREHFLDELFGPKAE